MKELQPIEASKLYLKNQIEQRLPKSSKIFDQRIVRGLERFSANTPDSFFSLRSNKHLRSILIAQFLVQKKIETALEKKTLRPLFLHLFPKASRICVAMSFSSSYSFQKEQIFNSLLTLVSGLEEWPQSFFTWNHPELPYHFWYFEVKKLRGKELSRVELKEIRGMLKDKLVSIPDLSPPFFWPYNQEESFRQIQLLRKEVTGKEDLPHVSIHFRGQVGSFLEFLIHFARPRAFESFDQALKRMPDALPRCWHFQREISRPFPLEIGAFSIKIAARMFYLNDAIHMLYARRYIAKHLEEVIGPFRDFNGGLFEKQQQYFEAIRLLFSHKIPHFDLFAEKIFYALYPLELGLSFSLETWENLFTAFSDLLKDKSPFASKTYPGIFTLMKTIEDPDLLGLRSASATSRLQLWIGGYSYLCLFGSSITSIENFQKQEKQTKKTLKLMFQEGSLLSLNPHYASGDMQSRILGKLLFEGLMRLDATGTPVPAAASEYEIGSDQMTYLFKIRPFCWSNGETVTSLDFVNSWQSALRDPIGHTELLFIIKNGKKFKEGRCEASALGLFAIDARTLAIELERPDPSFLYKLTQPYFFPLFGRLKEPKWFNGPYVLQEQTKDKLVLTKNPYFWDSKQISFEEIDIQWKKEIDEIDTLFQNEQIDWIGDPLSYLSTKEIERLKEKKLLRKQPTKRAFCLYFNTKHPLLKDPLVRKAFAAAINATFICSSTFIDCIPLSNEEPIKTDFPATSSITFRFSDQTRRKDLGAYLKNSWEKQLKIPISMIPTNWNDFRKCLETQEFDIAGTIQDIPDEESLEFLERFEKSSSWNFSNWSHPEYQTLLETKTPDALTKAKNILKEEIPFVPLFNYMHLYATAPSLTGFIFDQEGCVDFSRSFNQVHEGIIDQKDTPA
jgi:oligopeptide transport system substrate-binding protein